LGFGCFGWDLTCGPRAQNMPLLLAKDWVARSVRFLSTQHDHPVNPPCNQKTNGRARLQTIGVIQAAVFNPVSALQNAMIHLDAPPPTIPIQPLTSIFEVFCFDGGWKHPINRLFHVRPKTNFAGLAYVCGFPRAERAETRINTECDPRFCARHRDTQ